MLSTIYALLFYAATILFVVGLALRIRRYAVTPVPLKIPTTPAPITQGGVVLRMLREVLFFESLFKSNKWIWLFGWTFHMALWLILARHIRYVSAGSPFWLDLIQPFGKYAGYAMVAGLLGLWARRMVVDRVRYISNPSDHLILALLVSIGLSGLTMKFVAHTDIIAVKGFIRGLFVFQINPLPDDLFIHIHLGLVAVLMIIFPISKLLHAPGVFFSPTRNQVDNPREQRHLAPWAAELEK